MLKSLKQEREQERNVKKRQTPLTCTSVNVCACAE
jgi:hypothetical protein